MPPCTEGQEPARTASLGGHLVDSAPCMRGPGLTPQTCSRAVHRSQEGQETRREAEQGLEVFCKEGREKGEKRACVMRWSKWKRETPPEATGRTRTAALPAGGPGPLTGQACLGLSGFSQKGGKWTRIACGEFPKYTGSGPSVPEILIFFGQRPKMCILGGIKEIDTSKVLRRAHISSQ